MSLRNKANFREEKKSNRCKNFDMYGRPVSLTFKGNEKYKTPIGAVLTIFVVSLLLTYALFNSLKLDNLQQPIQTVFHESSFYQINKWLNADEPLQPNKIFAMGHGTEIVDPSIG